MKSLAEIYEQHAGSDARTGCDKNTVHSYLETYAELLAPYRSTAKRVLEVGIMGGHSLRMWEEFFDGAEVHGVDLCDQPFSGLADLRPMIAEGTHHIHLFDAMLSERVEEHFAGKVFDVIIEDASHSIESQLEIYANLKSHVAPGGIYIIEDVENIDASRKKLEQIDPDCLVRVFDLRDRKKRFDDVLVVIGGK